MFCEAIYSRYLRGERTEFWSGSYVTGANRPVMGQTPRDLVWKRDKACLWHYRSDDGARPRYQPPVLIVHSLVSKSYVLDLLPHTSMLRYLVGEALTCSCSTGSRPTRPTARTRLRRTSTVHPRGGWCRDAGGWRARGPFDRLLLRRVFRQTVDLLIRQNALNHGVVPLGRRELRLQDIRCPFLKVYAQADTIRPAASSTPLTKLVGSDDTAELRLESGHIGFVAGRQAAKVVRPQISGWLANHSEAIRGAGE